MSKMEVRYTQNLVCEATHIDSGTVIHTAAPKDNQGDGSAFSPTDLTCISVATCVITTMAIKARALQVPFEGLTASVQKIMSQTPPRKIAEIIVDLNWNGLDKKITPEQLESLKRSGENCPVTLSLDPSVKKTVRW